MTSTIERFSDIRTRLTNRELFEKEISKYQKEVINELYPKKILTDEIECVVCGKCYTRKYNSQHCKSKRHRKHLDEIYNSIYNIK